MTKIQTKHTPGPWTYEVSENCDSMFSVYYELGQIAEVERRNGDNDEQVMAEAEANARLIAASPALLAYAECEAAIACGEADPRYDPYPVLISHGWNEETEESIRLFLSRIRREAIEAATGSYLGRAA